MNRVKYGSRHCRLNAWYIRVLFAILVLNGMQLYAQESGYISIELEPKESNVYLDGVLISSHSPVELDNIQFGDHLLKIENVKYEFAILINLTLSSEISSLIVKASFYFGTIDIASNSEIASIMLDGKKVGTKMYTGALENPNSVIKISADATPIIEDEDVGSLTIYCSNSDAEVFVDGVSQGSHPGTIKDLAAGDHKVMVMKNGFETYNQNIQIRANQTYTLEVDLKKQQYSIGLGSQPSEAQIFLDGEFKGFTPLKVLAESGPHQVRLVHPDFDEMHESIEVFSERNFEYNLEVSNARIAFLSSPSRASVLVDGQNIGNTPVSKDLRLGYKAITFQKKGFESLSRDYKVVENGELSVILYPTSYRKKPVALLASVLWPGAGQSYLNRGSWHVAFGLAGYGSVAGWQVFRAKTYETYDLYLDATDSNERQRLKTEFQDFHSKSNYFLIGAGVIWGSNLLWTALMPDEETRYRRLELNAFYDDFTASPHIGLAINF